MYRASNHRLTDHPFRARLALMALAVGMLCCSLPQATLAGEALQVPASWGEPDAMAIHEPLAAWLEQRQLPEAQQSRVTAAEAALLNAINGAQIFDELMNVIAAADPEAEAFIMACRTDPPVSLGTLDELTQRLGWPPVVTNNLRLLWGKSLAIGQLYDEAAQQLTQLEVDQVADPSSWLFYLGATQYRLRQRDAALETIGKLLQRGDEIAARYATIARLMEADLRAHEPDSLGDIARIMDSIRVRLGHGRAGQRVRGEEQEVIDKLDKLIDDLEQQLQQMQASQGAGAAGGLAPSAPMQDSMPAGGTGPGDVDPKSLGDATDWGKLSPKQREEALQQLGDDFPSHYRDVIEEYFRQLAKEGDR